jgi:hypothetical protein
MLAGSEGEQVWAERLYGAKDRYSLFLPFCTLGLHQVGFLPELAHS